MIYKDLEIWRVFFAKVHCKFLKSNVLWSHLEVLKINERFVTIFGVIHHANIKQFEIPFRASSALDKN